MRVCGTFFAPQFSILVFSFVFFCFQFSPMTAYFSEKRLRYSRERALRSRALRLEITLCGFLFHRPASFKDVMRMAQVILRWHSTVILRWHSHMSYTGSSHSGGHFQIHRSLLRIMWIFRRSGSSSLFFLRSGRVFPLHLPPALQAFPRDFARADANTRKSHGDAAAPSQPSRTPCHGRLRDPLLRGASHQESLHPVHQRARSKYFEWY